MAELSKLHLRRLRALVKRLAKESAQNKRDADRRYKKGGHSDEDWTMSFKASGLAIGLAYSAARLDILLDELEGK